MVGRDENGRFVKGHNSRGGRKPRAEEREIIAALEGACPLADVLGMFHDAIMCGQDWAIKLYLAYRWGSPRQQVENSITGADGGDLVIVVSAKADADEG